MARSGNRNMDSGSFLRRRAHRHLPSLCAAFVLSSPVATAFPLASSHASRSAVVQRHYRVEDGSAASASSDASRPKHQSDDVYSLLPSRLSPSVGRLDEPSQYRSQVLEESDSLVVVRFYSEACASCKATRPLFTKWSRDLETNGMAGGNDPSSKGIANDGTLPIKIVEMPLNRATSSLIRKDLRISKLPYCHLYYPGFGMVEERVVVNKNDFREFADMVHCWSKGGCHADLESKLIDAEDEYCAEYC